MNNDFYEHNNIDAYLSGELSSAEKSAFEKKLQQDPLLQQELAFQQDMLAAIGQHRTIQLKSRLNNIQVGNTGQTSYLGLRWAAAISGIVLLVSIIYFFTRTTEQPIAVNQPIQQETIVGIAPVQKAERTEIRQEATQSSKPAIVYKEADKKKSISAISKPARVVKPIEQLSNIDEEIAIPADQPVQPGKPAEFNKTDEAIPTGAIDNSATAAKKAIDVSLRTDPNLSFHYQYFNNKIFLYGDFTTMPYELLEINDAEGRTLYMNYDSAFYLLKSNTMEPAPLQKIQDSLLINALKQKLTRK